MVGLELSGGDEYSTAQQMFEAPFNEKWDWGRGTFGREVDDVIELCFRAFLALHPTSKSIYKYGVQAYT